MVATRSSNRSSQADAPQADEADAPQRHAAVSGRVSKPKKANKAKKKPSAAMKAEELEFESQLMKQVQLEDVIFQQRFDPPWLQYPSLSLLGLPLHILNKIINFILPIEPQLQQQNSLARQSSDEENFQGPFFHCTYIHPILWTCRQLRYDYGYRFLMANHFMWFVPRDWDSTQITRFTLHAATVGAYDFPLFMDLSTRVDGPGYKCYPHAPLEEGCRANLDRWMKTVYYGVVTRVLVNDYPLRRDDGMIAHFLHQAEQYRNQGKSWEQLLKSLEEPWEAYLERRDLAKVNLGKDVPTMTALYKASNARLEMARATGLGVGSTS